MKTTGIVRRIDELGRIVIPKEIRKTLKIKSGEPIEISVIENEICLKKYSPLTISEKEIDSICQILSSVAEKDVLITDTEKVVSASSGLKGCIGSYLTKDAVKIVADKKSLIINATEKTSAIKLTISDSENYKNQLIVPIIGSENDSFGIIAMLDNEDNYKFTPAEIKLLRLTSKLVANKF